MKKFDMLVRVDESEPPDTENGHTDLYETFFVALFWMILVLLSTFAAVMMTLLIVTSDYFCPKTVQALVIASCVYFAIASGVTSSMFRQCIFFHIDWVEMKLYDLFNSVGLPLAGDISRLFDFISRRLRVRRVRFNQEDTVHVIHRYISDQSWALDKTAALNYFQRRHIRLFIQGWEIERQIGLLPPNLCASLDRMLKWYDVDEIDFFFREYETLDTIKEARRLHAQQFCLVLDELLTTTTASTPVDAKSKSFLGNVASEPTIVHVDELIDTTRNSLSSIASKSEHSTHPTTVGELIQSCRIALHMLFAPLVGVGTVMISLVLMSIAANCGYISVVKALVLATSSVYIVISAIMKLLGTIHGIHFNAVRDMCGTSIASITSYVASRINHLCRILCCIWHSIAGQLMRLRDKPTFIALEYTLSGLRCIRMRIKLICFVASCRAIFSDIRSLTSYVWSCIILLQSIIVQRTWHCILGQFTRAKVKIMDTAAHTPESSMFKRYRAFTSTDGLSKARRISGSRRSRKKRQYDQRIAKRS